MFSEIFLYFCFFEPALVIAMKKWLCKSGQKMLCKVISCWFFDLILACSFFGGLIQVLGCIVCWIGWPSLKEFVLTLSAECTQWIKQEIRIIITQRVGNLTPTVQPPLAAHKYFKESPFLHWVPAVSLYWWRETFGSHNHVVWLFLSAHEHCMNKLLSC